MFLTLYGHILSPGNPRHLSDPVFASHVTDICILTLQIASGPKDAYMIEETDLNITSISGQCEFL